MSVAQQIVYPYGTEDITLTSTQSIAVQASGEGVVKVYQQVGYPNYPSSFSLLAELQTNEQVFGPFTGGAVIRIEAGPDPVLYNVDVAPVSAVTFKSPFSDVSFVKYESDFVTYVPTEWTITEVGSGTRALTDAIGGQLLVTNAAADNDRNWFQLGSTNGESFAFQAGKKLWFDARFKVDNVLADTLIGLYVTDTDPEGGVASGVYFRRLTTATALDLIVENATTETVVTTGITMANDTFVNVGFYYDGARLFVTRNRRILAEVTTLTNLTSTELRLSFGVQNGTAAARSMTIDWIAAACER